MRLEPKDTLRDTSLTPGTCFSTRDNGALAGLCTGCVQAIQIIPHHSGRSGPMCKAADGGDQLSQTLIFMQPSDLHFCATLASNLHETIPSAILLRYFNPSPYTLLREASTCPSQVAMA